MYLPCFIGLFCTTVLQLACKSEPAFSKSEIAEMSQRGDALYAANSASDCERPRLRSGTLEPSAALSDSKDLFALVDPAGPFAECLAFLARKPLTPEEAAMLADSEDDGELNDFRPAKRRPRPVAQLENISKREALERVLFDYEENRGRPYYVMPWHKVEPKVMASLRAQCTGFAKRVQEVVARNSSCSPASLGGLAPEREFAFAEEVIKLSTILAVESRALVRDGQPLRAAQLLLDGMRLGDDFSRGRVSILVELMVQALTKSLFGQLAHLVLESAALDTDQLQRVYEELATLIDTQTPPSDRFAGEELAMMKAAMAGAMSAPESTNIDESLLAVLGLEFLATARYKHCPSGSSYAACIEGWKSFNERLASGEEELPFVATKSKALRKQASELMAGFSSRDKYLRKLSLGSARLAALELAMRSRRDGSCPAETKPGSNLDVTMAQNLVLIKVAKALQLESGNDVLLEFACPAEETPAPAPAP